MIQSIMIHTPLYALPSSLAIVWLFLVAYILKNHFLTEYPDVINDSLREFSFGISNDEKEIIFYKNKLAGKNFEYKISDSISFESGGKYFFHAKEKETPDISAEIMVPKPPPELSLISLKTDILILDKPNDYRCSLGGVDKFIRRTAEIEFSFSNINPDSYYAVLLIGSYSDSRVDWSPGWGSNLIEFNILECNTNGFFFHLHDRKTIQKFKNRMFNYCGDIVRLRQLSSTYFIDPGRIPYCTLKISTYWDYERFIPGYIKCFRIRLMSISKETYLFYKSLYTFNTQKDDPFSELVNINGNIVGGNGIIALCRSRELIVYTDQTGGRDDPFF